MSVPPKPLTDHERHQLAGYLESLCEGDPRVYDESRNLALSFEDRVEVWHERTIVLPRGVDLVKSINEDGDLVHKVEWPDIPLPRPPIAVHDPAVAAAVVWTVFMLRRPWNIDDDRLRGLIDDPPVAHARLLGFLISIRFSAWVLEAVPRMADACSGHIPRGIKEGMDDIYESLERLQRIYLARISLTIHDVSDLLGVKEPNASLHHEVCRWRWMLFDYLDAVGSTFNDRLEVLARRYDNPSGENSPGLLWEDICDHRQLDTCTGLLLARASMLDPRSHRNSLVDFIDPLAARSTGSLAWWCHLAMEDLDAPHPFGARLPAEEIETFVATARDAIAQLDEPYLDALIETFPSLRP